MDLKKTPSSKGSTEGAHDLLRERHHPLEAFFQPGRIAVIGATEREGSVGRTILRNLLTPSFGGEIFPVNPKWTQVFGLKCYPSVSAIADPLDLAIVVTPAKQVPGLIGQCVDAGVEGAIVVSAGFKEAGEAGAALEREILAHLHRGKTRLIGPNCLGVMCPINGLNATFAGTIALPGNVAFISQSGALCTAILDWSLRDLFGFSAFISLGSMLDVGWGDLIDYLGDDPHTQSIVLYMESIGNARSFLSSAREVALTKPIIVIKAGRTEEAAKAAASHTGALTGSDEVLDAAFRRSGVLRVNTISDLFNMAEVLAKQPRPKGPRLMIVTNAGGPAVLATDALIAGGGQLAEPSAASLEALSGILPPHWSHANPIDVLGDASPERYAKAVQIAAKDPNADGLLAILAPQAMTDPTQTAEELRPHARIHGRPILASWMGGGAVAAGDAILNGAKIPTFPFPDTATRIFNYMWRYSDNLRGLYETPTLPLDSDPEGTQRLRAEQTIREARAAGHTLLTEFDSKRLLALYEIPTVETRLATCEQEAIECAREIGYPVVLKLHSRTLTHKSDVGGVRLDLVDSAAVTEAYRGIEESVRKKSGEGHFQGVTVQKMERREGIELILGSSLDPDFGPVLLFGTGGKMVEVFKDRALALPPLNTTLARRMMERTRIYSALGGIRGQGPVDLHGLEQLLVRFGQMVLEHRWIREIDINPLLASSEGFVALDARVMLHGADMQEDALPKAAVRPYPIQYVKGWTLKNGSPVTIRPIRPEDEPLMVKFHQSVSDQSVYLRYHNQFKLSQRIAHERLTRICFIDYDRQMALVAERKDDQEGVHEIIGAARLSKRFGENEAEFAVLIADRYQGQGLGSELLRRLVEIGRNEGLRRIVAYILPENGVMQRICERLGFRLAARGGAEPVRAEIDL